MRFLYINFELD